jgi:hypothetical protein
MVRADPIASFSSGVVLPKVLIHWILHLHIAFSPLSECQLDWGLLGPAQLVT